MRFLSSFLTPDGKSLSFAFLTVSLLATLVHAATAQTPEKSQSQPDTLRQIDLPVIVVTATRLPTAIRDVAIPTQVITSVQIREQGALRLSDLLAEQTGLMIQNDFGAGIQIQGFDSEYTLILIDGEPLIGRMGGTLDLSRIALADIDHVEIVEGPSSSLYGSDALAGVINIITREAKDGISASGSVRMESHKTSDINASIGIASDRGGIRLQYNRFGTSGYDLSPDVIGLTAPGFLDQIASLRGSAVLTDRIFFDLNARYANLSQNNLIGFQDSNVTFSFSEQAIRKDWSISPRVKIATGSGAIFSIRSHASKYETSSTLEDENGRSEIRFEQSLNKLEFQGDIVLGASSILSLGGGAVAESVVADRVAGGKRISSNFYGFGQYQWLPGSSFEVVLSGRFDHHSDYDSRFNPKAAVLWRATSHIKVRGSVGSGFKSPSFQQLYMDFTNPVAGYSVFGASDVAEALNAFEEAGLIRFLLTDPSVLSDIKPESSVSYNLSLETELSSSLRGELRMFHNDVENLIDILPVATKINGQNIFTYINLNRIYTQGINADLRWKLSERVSLSLGYQYLETADKDVLSKIEDGLIFTRADGIDRRISRSEYGGLFNRSKHSGSVRLAYRMARPSLVVTVRGIYRSRYGFGDINGNLILDHPGEYVAGYAVWNVTASRQVTSKTAIQAGIRNLFGFTNTALIPSIPGRVLFLGLNMAL